MELKQQVEGFMRELFHARIAEEKTILANRRAYREKFFTAECRWDNREFTLEMIESERVVGIHSSDSNITVVSEYGVSVAPPSARINQRRYHLKVEGQRFLICQVDLQCPYCHGRGDADCIGCGGRHWMVV